MMKKMLRMLLLGFLTVTVLSPSVVTAEEDQTGQLPSSSAYSEIDGIAPLATPFIEEITLDNGESYDLIKKCLALPEKETYISFKIRTKSQEKEAFSLQPITTLPVHGRDSVIYFYDTSYYATYYTDIEDSPITPEVHDGGVRITNYSSGPTKYRIGINIVYDPFDRDFELG